MLNQQLIWIQREPSSPRNVCDECETQKLGENVRNGHLTKFMLKMKNSGHSQNYRTQILKSSFNAFEKMLEEDRKGSKPLYRPRSWNAENRLQYKENKKNN